MYKRGFGYDEFSDKITTHGQLHLSLLKESYQKNDLKRKITAVSFTTDFCPFCFLSNLVGRELFIFMLCFLLPLYVKSLSYQNFLLLYLPLLSCFFYIFHSHLSTYIKSSFYQTKNLIIHSYILYLVLQWILGWILGFPLLYIYILFENLIYLLC